MINSYIQQACFLYLRSPLLIPLEFASNMVASSIPAISSWQELIHIRHRGTKTSTVLYLSASAGTLLRNLLQRIVPSPRCSESGAFYFSCRFCPDRHGKSPVPPCLSIWHKPNSDKYLSQNFKSLPLISRNKYRHYPWNEACSPYTFEPINKEKIKIHFFPKQKAQCTRNPKFLAPVPLQHWFL